jgi:hypothetical protein
MSMQSKSYASPPGFPFFGGHVLWTSLNTVNVMIILLPFAFCYPGIVCGSSPQPGMDMELHRWTRFPALCAFATEVGLPISMLTF